MTDDAQVAIERVHARVKRLNRVTYLAGMLDAAELEGAIVFLEAATKDRRALPGMSPELARAGLAFMQPLEAW